MENYYLNSQNVKMYVTAGAIRLFMAVVLVDGQSWEQTLFFCYLQLFLYIIPISTPT